jgi:hypothetical protein
MTAMAADPIPQPAPDAALFFAQGPFAGRVDPWAEDAHYFGQLHGSIIAAMLSQIWQPLLQMGYTASKEASLQISELRKPDLALYGPSRLPHDAVPQVDYPIAAAAIRAEPGEAVEVDEPELQAIHLHEMATNTLVTVVEIISPRNKTHWADLYRYRQDREALFLSRGVSVVEIDLTRSVKRLLEHALTSRTAYHVAVFIPEAAPRVIPMAFNAPLKRCALPLREAVIGVELQAAYDTAYREAMIAPQLFSRGGYSEADLPFPTLLTPEQRREALDAVAAWTRALGRPVASQDGDA